MRRGEAIPRAAEDVDDVADRVGLGHPVAQGRAGQQLHHDEEAADLPGPKFLGVEIVDDHDVAVAKGGEGSGLGADGGRESIVGDARVELQRDLAPKLAVERLADDSARAVTERPQDLEPTVARHEALATEARDQQGATKAGLEVPHGFLTIDEGDARHGPRTVHHPSRSALDDLVTRNAVKPRR
jgi:hypothetical protein